MNWSRVHPLVVGVAAYALIGWIVAALPAGGRPPEPVAAAAPRPAMPPVRAQPAASPAAPAAAPSGERDGAAGAFEFRRHYVDAAPEQPTVCLAFTRPLAPSAVRYRDFLRISPAFQPAIEVSGANLCLGGLAYGTDYQVEILPGLPAADGTRLDAGQSVALGLGDRPPLVAFASGGAILPRESSFGVPVSTVNVARLRLDVYRVGERAFVPATADRYGGLFGQTQLYPYQVERLESEIGTKVWSGEMETVSAARNENAVTSFALREAVKPYRPGVYAIVASDAAEVPDEEDRYNRRRAAQWVIDSDLALTTFDGGDGLNVFVRSLATAAPVAGVELALVARNNDELGRAATGPDGRAAFAPGLLRGAGAAAPAAVMAHGPAGDFNLADLRRPAFDLSDRGVEGRAAPAGTDAFLYTDRGIYRPGETVQVTALLRDRVANALPDAPVTLVVVRADGTEVLRRALRSQAAGAVHLPIALGRNVPRGLWHVAAHVDPAAPPVGRVEFEVQDFVPQRLKLALTAAAPFVAPGEEVTIGVEGRFLYGAPAAALAGEGELRIEADRAPFPMHAGFRFGLEQESFKETILPLALEETDAQGRTTAQGRIELAAPTSLPLKATATISLFEPGGRATRDSTVLAVRTRPWMIGVRPRLADGRAAADSTAEFEVIAVDAAGARIARPGLSYQLVREEWRYNWYRSGNSWQWEGVVFDRPAASGRVDASAEGAAAIRAPVEWGPYRLTVHDPATQTATSVRFHAGWSAGGRTADTPDKLDVLADKNAYAAGESARVRIRGAAGGEALVVVAGDRIFETRSVTVPPEGTTIDVPVAAEWGAGAYVLVTLARPLGDGGGDSRAPVRMVGLAWLGIDPALRTLSVALAAPAVVRPRQAVTVPIAVTGKAPLSQAFVTLAAVDEGILQLTRFAAPAPAPYYFGKRRLGVAMRDDYGRLIDGRAGPAGRLRAGGDAAGLGGAGLEVVPTRTVALFSGLVALDAQGRAAIPIDVPDFTGELRLMAVAFDRTQAGSAAASMTVRDAVVSDATLPRFLAPGDRSRMSLLLHNLEGAPGSYRVALRGSGPVAIASGDSAVDLAAGERKLLSFALSGIEPGIARIVLSLSGPGGFAVERDWQIQVRPAQAPVTRERLESLPPGAELRLDGGLVAGFLPGTASVAASVGPWGGFNAPALLKTLSRYPFGCLEQITSRALPLLYFADLAAQAGLPGDAGVQQRVQDAVYDVADMQLADGSFEMWPFASRSPWSRPPPDWIGVYASDFLFQARARGFTVPDLALRRATPWLRRTVDSSYPNAAAYAALVLAREGAGDAGRLRYLHDTSLSKADGALGRAQLGAALALMGERARAQNAFASAEAAIGQTVRWDTYGSPLRDLAGAIAAAGAANQTPVLQTLLARFGRTGGLPQVQQMSTQEQAWLLLAANAVNRDQAEWRLAVDGRDVTGRSQPTLLSPSVADVARGYALANRGEREVWAAVAVTGVPAEPVAPRAFGLEIERSFHTLDGEEADLSALKQNQRLIVSLRGRATDRLYHEAVVLDLLPAGFEIEGVVSGDEEGKSAYDWLPPLTRARMREARDDRFVAAVNLGRWARVDGPWWWRFYGDGDDDARDEFHLAYIVRAITPGEYALPAASVEDMYAPNNAARTAMGTVAVAPRD